MQSSAIVSLLERARILIFVESHMRKIKQTTNITEKKKKDRNNEINKDNCFFTFCFFLPLVLLSTAMSIIYLSSTWKDASIHYSRIYLYLSALLCRHFSVLNFF